MLAVLADAAASSAFVLLVDADDALAVALLAAAVADAIIAGKGDGAVPVKDEFVEVEAKDEQAPAAE